MAKRKRDPIVHGEVQPKPQPQLQYVVKTHNAADYKLVYSNYVHVGYTLFDLAIIFGENVALENTDFIVENKVRVSMAPTEAKILRRVLDNAIKQYERQFGPIKMSDSFLPAEVP